MSLRSRFTTPVYLERVGAGGKCLELVGPFHTPLRCAMVLTNLNHRRKGHLFHPVPGLFRNNVRKETTMGTKQKNIVTIEFKDPDLGSDFERAGVTSKAIEKLEKLADFSEYWRLRLTMNPDGTIAEAKFVDAR